MLRLKATFSVFTSCYVFSLVPFTEDMSEDPADSTPTHSEDGDKSLRDEDMRVTDADEEEVEMKEVELPIELPVTHKGNL